MGSPGAGENDSLTNSSRPKRTDNACRGCRERKVKCSGTQPCSTCIRRHQECVFELEERKIFVSRRYLDELKRKSTSSEDDNASSRKRRRVSLANSDRESSPRATRAVSQPEPAPAITLADEIISTSNKTSQDEEQGIQSSSNIRNLLASRPSCFVTDESGRRRFLGPTSTWSYTQQIKILIRKHLQNPDLPKAPLNPEGLPFVLEWPSTSKVGPLSLNTLPSLEFALYLTNTVKFHLGRLYHLFHEKTFINGLYKFYEEGPYAEPSPDNRLWYVQFLLIMAFGNALLSGYVERKPAGSELVSRAIELMPDAFGLNRNPVLATEVLCCLALYLQSIDHRNSAFVYIGQAMSMALSQGLHRELVGDDLTDEDIERYHAVWWTIYILYRRFSSLMGAPNSIRDDDITVPLPDFQQDSPSAKAMSLQVSLARLHAQVLSTVYSSDTHLKASYLKNTREVLKSMANLASDLKEVFGIRFDNDGPICRVAATLNLYYHQCIVLSTRPLLFCLLRRLLSQMLEGHGYLEITEPIKALLRAAQDSAARSLRILMALHSQRLLENFLPFDLESTFSSAFVLSLMAALPSCPLESTADVDASFYLLNQMVAKGNVIAELRKEDLEQLIHLLHLVSAEIAQRGPLVTNAVATVPVPNATDYDQILSDQLGGIDGFNGLSPEQMLSLAGLLESDTVFDHIDEQWLWA
ncbi:fungal-specific transcription factor domain-containing protein [Xylaria arbuscula]|nr:fungal-specific transcription factor domain-containing protein [Xylaria arbuscula]